MLGFYGYNCGDVYDVSSPNVSRRPNVPSTSRPSAAMTSQLRMEPHRDICWATQNLGLEWGRMKNPNPNLYIYNRGYSYNSHNNIILYIYIILDHINQQPIGDLPDNLWNFPANHETSEAPFASRRGLWGSWRCPAGVVFVTVEKLLYLRTIIYQS